MQMKSWCDVKLFLHGEEFFVFQQNAENKRKQKTVAHFAPEVSGLARLMAVSFSGLKESTELMLQSTLSLFKLPLYFDCLYQVDFFPPLSLPSDSLPYNSRSTVLLSPTLQLSDAPPLPPSLLSHCREG